MEYHVNSAVYQAEAKERLKKANFDGAQVDALAEEFGTIRADMAEVKHRLGKVENKLGQVENRLGQVEDGVNEVKDTSKRTLDIVLAIRDGA
jgi:archaellum component FlaC